MFYNQKTVHFNYNYQNISAIHFCGLYNCFCLLHILSKCTTFALEIIFTAEITSYYNNDRIKLRLNMSPVQYRQIYMNNMSMNMHTINNIY